MAYHIDPIDKSIVVDGFQNGIADSPYDGIADMRNINIISIPNEGSVNFSTSQISPPSVGIGTVTSANTGTEYFTYTGASGLENYMAILFTATTVTGITINTTYWVADLNGAGAGTFHLYADYAQTSLINVTGSGTGTFRVAVVGTNLVTTATGIPRFFAYDADDSAYFMLDATGALWSNLHTTTSGYWTYLGPSGTADTNAGNGLVYYRASDGTRWVFTFNSQTIDYFDLVTQTWTYGWRPSTGGTHQTGYLKKATTFHNALVAPDNKVYYCDGNWIGRWYQADPAVPFVPTTPSTYVFDQTQVLPFTDAAQCIAPLGNNLLIGGKNNVIYPWDTFSQVPNFPILVAESNIVQLVTVNTNTFIFVGNRGRIYYTNGSQAQLYKKIPDHISGTVEPYFTWGGATSQKNQLYFSALVATNAGVASTQYGGVWAIDLDTKAIRLTNKLSYGTYGGYSTAIIANFGTNPAGTGLYIGWNASAGNSGIDTTISTPYTGSQASIDSDLIPVGTFDRPTDFERMEYKLARPLVSGESINLYARLIFNTQDTGFGSAILTDATAGNFSSSSPVNFKNAQWLQLKAVLNSTASSPSYVRLKEIRIKRPSQ